MRAYVTRFDDISELEDWIAAGIAPIVSVSSWLTNDRHSGPDNGHLIVVVGFTKDGDVITNNPGVSVKRNIRARQTYPRDRLINAWKKSKNTVYLVLVPKSAGSADPPPPPPPPPRGGGGGGARARAGVCVYIYRYIWGIRTSSSDENRIGTG